MKKRVLSIILALAVALGLMVPVLAADEFEAEATAVVEEAVPETPTVPEVPAAAEPVPVE